MGDFSVSFPGMDNSQRRAFRATVPGLEIFIKQKGGAYAVKDISAMGLAVGGKSLQDFTEGEVYEFDLLLNKKLYIAKMHAKVMRVLDNGIVGCNFEQLDRRQEARLDKLILEVQKRMIAMKKAQQAKDAKNDKQET